MDCLSPEQLVSYVRGGGHDPRSVEAHVRDCPACAMDLLLARETLAEGRAKATRPATDRFRKVAPRRPTPWLPWVAAAALLVAAVAFAVLSQKTETPAPVVRPPDKPKVVVPPVPKPEPLPEPPKPPPPAPAPKPEPKPEGKPEPPPVKPPEPPQPPPPPKPEPVPEPKKPAPTLVE